MINRGNKGIKVGDSIHLAHWNDLATIGRIITYEAAVSLQKQGYSNFAVFIGNKDCKYFLAASDAIENRVYVLPENILVD